MSFNYRRHGVVKYPSDSYSSIICVSLLIWKSPFHDDLQTKEQKGKQKKKFFLITFTDLNCVSQVLSSNLFGDYSFQTERCSFTCPKVCLNSLFSDPTRPIYQRCKTFFSWCWPFCKKKEKKGNLDVPSL